MFKTGVGGTRIYVLREGQLSDSSESLENRMVHDVPFPVVQLHETMDGYANRVASYHFPNILVGLDALSRVSTDGCRAIR